MSSRQRPTKRRWRGFSPTHRAGAAKLPDEKQARPGLQVVTEVEASPRAASEPAAVPRDLATAAPRRTAQRATRRCHRDVGGSPRRASGAPGAAVESEPRPTERRCPDRRMPRVTPPVDPPHVDASAPEGEPKSRETASAAAASPAAAVVTGASLSVDELCAASGLSLDEVAGLKGFGLVESVTVAGIETYDEDALTVANLAVAFRAFGIELRHLRLYRNAADRELGLIEQVVIPLLRQRNPESRQRAVEGADQLAALGQSMRATLLRQALRRHLGG